MEISEQYRTKISLVGDLGTGKTSLILRYVKNEFTQEYLPTLGAQFLEKTFSHEDMPELHEHGKFDLTIWDLAGQTHFLEIIKLYLEESAGVIIVFAVDNKSSFENIRKWYKFVVENLPNKPFVMIWGNKADLDNQIPQEEITKLEQELGIKIRYTSALVDLEHETSNVHDNFLELAKNVFQKFCK